MEKNELKSHLIMLANKLWRYISKDILDRYKSVEKVFAVNL